MSEISVKLNEQELREILLNMTIDWECYHKGRTHYMDEKAHERLVEKLEGTLAELREWKKRGGR